MLCTYEITFIDGTTQAGMATGTVDEVFAYLSQEVRGISRLEVHPADDMLVWASADWQPNHV